MRFSVIIPVYNKAPYVAKALGSVLHQTFSDYELIVVDDGSTDGSDSIVRKTLYPDKGILIPQTNAGVSTARNNGVKASKGEYICFLDADDWWEPTFLEEMDKLIDGYSDVGIYGMGYYIVKNGRKRVAPIGVESVFKVGYINYCQVYARTLCMPLTSISVAVPRPIFNEMGGFRPHLRLGEDFDLWIKIALKYKVAFLNKPLSNYNQDVDLRYRGTRHVHDPRFHMLWNLDYLQEYESLNVDYKQLVDKLRVSGLWKHYLSSEYHEQAVEELSKVDWSLQPKSVKQQYEAPLWLMRVKDWLLVQGSGCKQWLLRKYCLVKK